MALRTDSTTQMLRIALVGCGWAARTLHVDGIRKSGVGRIVAASDPLDGARKLLGADRGFRDWREMLEETSCDAVLIASPPTEHASAAVFALEKGLPVLIEKPLAATLEDARRIADAAHATGQTVAVGFNQRCHPTLRRVQKQIVQRRWGQLKSVKVNWSSGAGFGTRSWIGKRSEGGGALLDLGSHVIDLWRFLSNDEIEWLEAASQSVILDDQSASIRARMRGGAEMSAELSLVGSDVYEIEIVCERKKFSLKPYGRGFHQSYAEQWKSFARAIEGIGRAAAGIEDGLASLRCVLQATRGLAERPNATWPRVEFPMSVIASTTVGYQSLRTTIVHLGRQSIASQIQLVIVGPSLESLAAPESEFSAFGAVEKVSIGPVQSIAHANAAGVRHARGRIVALTEDHCFPEPGWAEALLRAHEHEYSVVGPAVLNGNPRSTVSEADFVIGYGPWMAPMGPEEMKFLPGHNSSYKRDELLALGERLERLLESETVLHMEWSAQGRRLRVEPAALTRHVNYSLWRSWIPVQILAGRVFGGLRAENWPQRRKLFYAAASPLIPLVRMWRCALEFRKPGRSVWRLLRMAPALALGLVLDGAGQCLGYLLGPGDAMNRLTRYEFNRIEHVKSEDRQLWISQ